VAEAGADLRGVGVDERRHREPAIAEAAVVREGLPEVADADDDDRPVLGETELATHLEQQVLDVVPDAASPVGAEVREVLAHLGRVDAGQLGQPLRRDGAGLVVRLLDQAAQVDRQARHGRLRDAPRPSAPPNHHLGTAFGDPPSASGSRIALAPLALRSRARPGNVVGHIATAHGDPPTLRSPTATA
jgi:hypothetical protein